MYFKDKLSSIEPFQGAGQMLGGETRPSRLVPSNLNKKKSAAGFTHPYTEETSQLPGEFYSCLVEWGQDLIAQYLYRNTELFLLVLIICLHLYCYIAGPKLTMDQFLNKLPQNVVKGGKVIDVRADLSASLTVSICYNFCILTGKKDKNSEMFSSK